MHRLYDDIDGVYVCPLCEGEFECSALNAQLLTIEHAPPKCIGGKEVVLTCKECNAFASREYDKHMQGHEYALDFANNVTRKPMDASITANGTALRGNYSATGDVVTFKVATGANAPHALQAFSLDGAKEWSVSLDLTFEPARARCGWLRAGYLIAFAAFGYRWALRESLAPVRDVIAQRADPPASMGSLVDPRAPVGRREVVIVVEPAELRSVLIGIDRRTILLPFDTRDPDFFERVASMFPKDTGRDRRGVCSRSHGRKCRCTRGIPDPRASRTR